MVTFCPKCGTQALDDQSSFCNKCGTQLPVEISEEQGNFCPNCKTKIPDEETISCPRCGFLFSTHPPSSHPVKPAKYCPRCHAPVTDESRYYCKTCGAYIRDVQAGKVSVADDSSSSPASIKKPVIIPGIYQNTGTGTIIKPEPVAKKRSMDLSNPTVKKMGIFAVVLGGILLLVWGGVILLGSGTFLQSDSDVLITQDLGSMALTLSDLPSGWVSGEAEGTGDTYSVQFFTESENNEALVEQNITRYPGREEARQELNSQRAQATDVPVETINLGDEGFGFIDVNYVMVIFRKGNILVKIEDTRTEYQGNPTLNNARNYAEIVAKRIK
jgi:DNA-directed RNA polymerase subunit RPC12/RpoP